MSRKNVLGAIRNSLGDLNKEQFDEFCHMLTEQPPVRSCEVHSKSLGGIVAAYGTTTQADIDFKNAAHKVAEALAAQAKPQQEPSRTPPPPQFSSGAGPSGAPARRGHFVDRHSSELIDRVSNMGPILDHLLEKGVLHPEQYDKALTILTTQDQMRFLFRGPLKSGGDRSKDVLLNALETIVPNSYLIEELKEKEG